MFVMATVPKKSRISRSSSISVTTWMDASVRLDGAETGDKSTLKSQRPRFDLPSNTFTNRARTDTETRAS